MVRNRLCLLMWNKLQLSYIKDPPIVMSEVIEIVPECLCSFLFVSMSFKNQKLIYFYSSIKETFFLSFFIFPNFLSFNVHHSVSTIEI